MQLWNLKTPYGNGGRDPRELVSTPDVRADEIDLDRDEELGGAGDRGPAVPEVHSRDVDLRVNYETTIREEGESVAVKPGEAHSVRAVAQLRLLVTCAFRPALRVHNSGSG